MRLLDWLALLCAAPVVVAYLCRLTALHLRLHKLTVIAMHLALFGSTFGVGVTAARGQTQAEDLLALAGAALWIVVSLATWGKGVPRHALRQPEHKEPTA